VNRHPRISVQLGVSFAARFLDLNGLRGAGRLERGL
jgi:hypothetical protein